MRIRGRLTLAVAFLLTVLSTATLTAQVNLTSLGTPATENFNTLAASGTSTTLPTGWSFVETGSSANTTYTAGTGSSATGDTYSFGSAAVPTDRAFGGLLSGTLVPTIGASFTNNTNGTITSLVIAYTGEEWRLGTTGRGVADRLDFQYSTDATSLTTGTWTDVNTLDFSSPDIAGTLGLRDGNAAADRTAIGPITISGLSIANGATFWIRWTDFNVTNSDDGLAVDDFSLTPQGVPTPPAVSSITRLDPDPSNAATVRYSVVFTQSVTGVDVSDFTLVKTAGQSGATLDPSIGGSGTTYTVTVNTGGGDGTVQVNVNNGASISNANGSLSAGATGPTYTIDKTPPSVSSVNSATANGTYKVGDPISITVTFTEPVAVTGVPTLALNSGGTATYASGGGSSALTFSYTVGAGQSASDLDYTSTNALALAGGSISDPSTNAAVLTLPTVGGPNSLGGQKDIVIDGIAPTISSSTVPASGSYGIGQALDLTVTFSEPVFVTGTPSVALTLNVPGAVQANYFSGTGSSTLTFRYTVASGNSDNDGIGTASSITGGTIKDGAGNSAATAVTFASTTGVLVDGIAPTVISSTVPANGTYVAGQTLDYSVTFSEPVVVTGNPFVALTLNTGGAVQAAYVTGSGTATLQFQYTIASGNADPDGVTTAPSISLNSGSIKDSAGNNAATAVTFASTTSVLVDAIPPAISSSTVPASGTYRTGQNLDFTVTFSEPVNVLGTPFVGVTINTGGTVQAAYFSGTGTATLTFRYTVASGNEDTDGIGVASSISLNSGSIKDSAGNDAATAVTFASTAGVFVDGIAPSVSSSTVPANGTHIAGQTLDYSVTFSEPVVVTGSPFVALTLNTGGSVQAAYVSGSGNTTLQFQYTIASGNTDPDGVTTASSISLNGGTIKDPAGNNAATAVSFASTAGVYVDAIAPTVSSSILADADPTNASTLHYTVTFSEDVSGVTTSSFQLTATGGATGTISAFSPVNASTYTVTVTSAAGEGTLRLDVKSSGTGITDLPGNPLNGGFTTGQFYTLDHVGPNVTSVAVPADSTYTVGQNLDFTVNFDESAFVAGGTPRIALTLNSGSVYANYVSGSGSSALLFRYTVITGDSDPDGIDLGTTIDLNGATIRDLAGNDGNPTLNSVGSTTGVHVDANAPVVLSVTLNGATPTNVPDVDFNVTFSQSVTGVDSTDFEAHTTGGITPGSPTVISGNGVSFVVRVPTGTGDGTIRLDVLNNGTIQSASNNVLLGAGFTSGGVYTIDKTAPTAQSINRASATPTNAAAANFTVTFSESVSGVSASNFTLTGTGTSGASIGTPTSSNNIVWTVPVSTGSDGTLRLDLTTAAGIADPAGNTLAATRNGDQSYTIDKTTPSVLSIDRQGASTTAATSVVFDVTFSEPVLNVAQSNFSISQSGLTGAGITGFTGSGATYSVTASTGTGNGTLRLDFTDNDTVTDPAGNPIGGPGPTNGNFTGQTYTIDKTVPVVVSIVRAGAQNPTNATSVNFTVTFNTSVTGVVAGEFITTTTSGNVTSTAVGTPTGSGNTWTVPVTGITGDGGLRLDVVDHDAITGTSNGIPLGGTSSGNGNFNTGEIYTFDHIAPSVQSINRSSANPSNASSVNFTVTFSEAVSGVTASNFTLTGTGTTGTSIGTPTTANNIVWTVPVTTGNDGTLQLDLTSTAGITDPAGNALTGAHTGDQSYTIDKTSPAVQSIVKASADPTTATSVDFTVTFSESVTGVDGSDFTITAPSLTATSVTGVLGSGTTYTVSAATGNGSGSLRLDFTGTAIDAAGNSAAGFTTGQSYTIQGLPAAPTGLAASPGNAHVALNWNAVSSATSYNVKRSLSSGSGYSTLTNVAVTTYDDLSAVNGTQYFYKISAINGRGEGSDSTFASATPNAPPAAPSPVSIAVGDTKVILSWPAVAGATTYNVKRGTVSGTYPTTTSTASTTFTDSTVTNGTTYFYVVTAQSTAEGSPSSEVSGTPNTPNVLGVVISQVYGGGGNGSAPLTNDFVELFNRGTQTVSLSGWFVHYTSATGATWNASNSPTALSGTIAPGRHYLVQETAGNSCAGLPCGVALPSPDATGTIAMGAAGGKVALVGSSAALSVTCPTGSFIADFVGYGAMATNFCYEGSGPTAATSNTTAALRANAGCTDTNNNVSDFSIGPPNPRNSATSAIVCGAVNNPPTITPPANPIASVAQDALPFNVNVSGSDDGGVFVWSATPGTGVQSVSVNSGQSTATVAFHVTLVTGFSGTATFTASLSDGVNPAVTQAVNIQVTSSGGNSAPLITPPANPITTVAQDPSPFTVNLSGSDDNAIYNWSATPGTGVSSVNVTGGQGTATVTYTVALNAGFNGTATFTASLSDNVNPPATQAVNINVLPAGATPNHVVISQLYGGGGNGSATYTNDFIELYNPTASPVNMAGWSVQYSSATNTGGFSGLQPIGGTIGPGEYYLISLAGGATGSPLPAANITNNSGINMSGTTGKVALVSNGDFLAGPCATTLADPDIIDFVGYGTTANCNEGGSNAPAPSNNATSIFRKNGGNTDTNVNGNDFVTGAANPRRTTPIQEIGPSVVNTDPTTNAANAPRDASIIVTFTELVDVNAGWYNINCSSSGVHNDATVVEGAPDTWVITPNANFTPAEQCAVTIFKDFVHDRDTDDSVPGTDTLSADYTWTFTVATGAAPAYPSSVHLTMGNPSGATPSLLNPGNFLMQKPEMAISYNRDLGRPNWVSWHLSDEWVCCLTRVDTFRPDPSVPPAWYRVLASDFFASGFDRGHMTPNADRNSSASIPINQATFLMSNMVAQAPANNQGPWADLESYLRTLLPANELYIVSGPAGSGGTGSNGGVTTTLANGHVTVPAQTWKVALMLPKASGDDVARVTASTRTLAVIMPNTQSINSDWHTYIVSVKQVETLTGYNFFSNVPDAIQNSIEAGIDGTNPPGAGNQSVSATEDAPKTITMDAVSPTNGSMTWTIMSTPSHGNLTGSGPSRTYTPVPDFNGTDTFTFRVNDGTGNSNTATVSIAVAEVNDPPSAVDDSKSATTSTPLTFPASDLTANDSPGPANESGQTLTVASVTPTANTHGTVSLSSGQVTYTPTPAYTGPASFTYNACDNGLTAGSSDSKCSTANVNVVVSGCPPGPAPSANASNSGPACAGSSVNLFASGSGSSFSWTGPGGFTSTQQNLTGITVAGTYTVTVSNPGPCGNSAQASTTVVINPIPSATITTGGTACALSPGNSASVPNAGAGATYVWSITNGSITAGAGTRAITYTAGASGNVQLGVTVSANGCSANGSANVPITSGPTITVPSSLSACGPSLITVPFTLTGQGPWTVVWSDNNVQSGIVFPSASRLVGASASMVLSVVSVSDASCTSTNPGASVVITISTPPAITTPPKGQIVNPGSQATFTVAATGGSLHYQWFVRHANGATVPVGTDAPSYTTNPEGNAFWFVRVTNSCGSVDSETVNALVVTPRHRPSH